MPEKIEPAEFYRQEAERLRRKAASASFVDVKANLLDMAQRYEAMAVQAENLQNHTFGRPFGRQLRPV